jgi:superfamily I DNA/RNA helicase
MRPAPLLHLGRVREPVGGSNDPALEPTDDGYRPGEIAEAMLGWAAAHKTLVDLAAAVTAARTAIVELRRDEARLTLATAHGTKGLEFDHVAVVGLDAGRFPSARSIADASEPQRALQEERRLAYVAWTRARRSLTLVYDPGAPSRFLLEAFSPDELAPWRGGR